MIGCSFPLSRRINASHQLILIPAIIITAIVISIILSPGPAQGQDNVPAKPTGLSGTVSHDSVSLTWNDPDDSSITGYQILRRNRAVHDLGDFQVHVNDTGSAANSYVDEDVEPSQRYVYRIKARNSAGLSPRSRFFNADTPAAPPESPAVVEDECAANTSTTCAVTIGDTLSAGIGEEGDLDWIKVTPTANTAYRIEITTDLEDGDHLRDPYMGGIFDTNGVSLMNTRSTESNRSTQTNQGVRTLIHHFLADTDDPFFVSVGGREMDPMPATGSYGFRVVAETNSPDDFSARSTTSGELTLGEATSAKLQRSGDIDWFKVDLQQGQVYRISASGITSISGIYHDTSGGKAVKRSRGDHYPSYRDYDLAWIKASITGTHYIEIRPGHGLGRYQIKAEHIPLPGSDIAKNTSTTGSVPLDGSTYGRIDTPADVDWFRIHLTAGTKYRIEMEGTRQDHGTLDHHHLVGVYDPAGVITPGSYAPWSILSYRANETGDHYIAVGSPSGFGVNNRARTGIFRVSVAWVEGSVAEPGDGDCANSIETVCRLEVGDSVTGQVSPETEQDWFKVDLKANQMYRFELQGVTAGDDWLATLRPADGTDPIRGVASYHHAADAEVFAYRPATSGEYFVEVQPYGNPVDTAYTVSLREIEIDETADCADDSTTACSVSVGGSSVGYIESAEHGNRDVDWWAVSLEQSNTYVIDLKGAGDSTATRDNPQTIADPLSVLYDSDGVQLVSHNNVQEFSDGNANYNSRITYTVPAGQGGAHYLSAASGEVHLGTYEITVRLSE